ncbi:MAG: hypothetical protein FJ144_02055 [Deltaproteobacteria bacterium]|nr:hypothetical protein [Deltaproteobacteria bacterium]
MKKLLLVGAGAAVLLASASVGFAGPQTGDRPLSSTGREIAAERRLEAKPYALTGNSWEWEKDVERNPSGRDLGISFKRVVDQDRNN